MFFRGYQSSQSLIVIDRACSFVLLAVCKLQERSSFVAIIAHSSDIMSWYCCGKYHAMVYFYWYRSVNELSDDIHLTSSRRAFSLVLVRAGDRAVRGWIPTCVSNLALGSDWWRGLAHQLCVSWGSIVPFLGQYIAYLFTLLVWTAVSILICLYLCTWYYFRLSLSIFVHF